MIFISKKNGLLLFFLLLIFLSVGMFFHGTTQQRTTWRTGWIRSFVQNVSIFDVRMCICDPDEDVILQTGNGLTIAGSLYGLSGTEKRPVILVLHGNTPVARQLPMYKVLGRELARRGYLVLAIDFAGYGESGDPFSLGTKEALNRDGDVYAALKYLDKLDSADGQRMYLMGHSGGVSSAISVGIRESTINKIVAVGPARRVAERFSDTRASEYFWERAKQTRKEVYGRSLPEWYTKELYIKQVLDSDIEMYVPYFSAKDHKPILLMDGENEGSKDKEYLRDYYMKLSEPKHYVTIANSNHYFNVIGFSPLKSFWVNLYDNRVVTAAVDEIDQWLSR